jgi:hypothetical protein
MRDMVGGNGGVAGAARPRKGDGDCRDIGGWGGGGRRRGQSAICSDGNRKNMGEEDYRRMILYHLNEQTRAVRTIRAIAIFYVVMTLLPILLGLLSLLAFVLGLFSVGSLIQPSFR